MKTIKKHNFRVIIEPRRLGNFGFARMSDHLLYDSDETIQREYEKRCEEIVEDVKRHVDNVGHVSVEWDTEEVCSYCGRSWTESQDDLDHGFPKGSPYCCDAAVTEWNSSLTKK